MPICSKCGHANPEGARFCNGCAAPLVAGGAGREQRKTVTVLFCDLTGSTALGERLDPEALQALLARYFERMQAIVELHGGTVEKFIGDAVMAVFGVPTAHEDDALRACRAAVEMRDVFPQLGIEGRIGVDTGEVLASSGAKLATGDAVNVAARLEQAAEPGEVLIGETTLELARGSVEVERLDPLALKGKAERVPAFRLLAARTASERPHEGRFVGRRAELASLRGAWARALDERRCELATVVGDPGVGKSRLAAELLAGLDARVVRGRCLPYGDGITYWPVVEVVKQLGLPAEPDAAASLRALLGESDAGSSAEEIAWAFRKLLERSAPLCVLFDDIQWGEETFLDLVEHVSLLAVDAPILLLCLARPELVERRPQWPVALRLEPLPDAEVDALLPAEMPAALRERIGRAAGGNPLFVTEMIAMAADADGDVVVPPSLRALLAARLDRLDGDERRVLECGAVEGEIFHRGAVQALAAPAAQVTPRLAALTRKRLIKPVRAQLAGDDGFRFGHLLVRDAAYEALSKADRAELHERFADWLEQRGGLVELDELVGYHLEQAARYARELERPHAQLAARAGERLAAAGRRAYWCADRRTAAALLGRALELIRPLRLDVVLELDLLRARWPADLPELAAAAEEIARRARTAGDPAGAAVAAVAAGILRSQFEPEPRFDELETLAHEALPLLERQDDHLGLDYVWMAFWFAASARCRFEACAHAAEQRILHARRAGSPRMLSGLPEALIRGPRPADEALQALDDVMPEHAAPGMLALRGCLLAMLGRYEEAWPAACTDAERYRELGLDLAVNVSLAEIATLARDHETAAELLRELCDDLELRGLRTNLSTHAPQLGRSLCALGRHDEAEPLARLGLTLGADDDLTTQTLWRQVQALVDSHRGSHEEARRLAHEAVAISGQTDSLNMQGDALSDLATVLAAAGGHAEAAGALQEALERYERKRNLAMARQVRARLDALQPA